MRNCPCYSLGAISDSVDAMLDRKTLTKGQATKPFLTLATNNHQQLPKIPYYSEKESEKKEEKQYSDVEGEEYEPESEQESENPEEEISKSDQMEIENENNNANENARMIVDE